MTLSIKEERFVGGILKGLPQAEAARAAGFAAGNSRKQGSALARRPEIAAVIEAARAKVAAEAQFDVKKALAEAAAAEQRAVDAGQHGPAAKFFELRLKLAGMLDQAKDKGNGQANFSIRFVGLDRPAPIVIEADHHG